MIRCKNKARFSEAKIINTSKLISFLMNILCFFISIDLKRVSENRESHTNIDYGSFRYVLFVSIFKVLYYTIQHKKKVNNYKSLTTTSTIKTLYTYKKTKSIYSVIEKKREKKPNDYKLLA